MEQATVRALWHQALNDRVEWNDNQRHHSTWTIAVAAIIAVAVALPSFGDLTWVAIAALVGVVGGPFALWAYGMIHVWNHPLRRFESVPQNERPGVANTHARTTAIGRQFCGDPWWQIEYPDGSQGNWLQRQKYAGLTVQSKTGGFNFDFHRRDQEGVFIIRFRARIRDSDPPVPLGADRWEFTNEGGWTRVKP